MADGIHQDFYGLYRNGELYSTSVTHQALAETVLDNPDFFVKESGSLPTWKIIRYTVAEIVGCGGGE